MTRSQRAYMFIIDNLYVIAQELKIDEDWVYHMAHEITGDVERLTGYDLQEGEYKERNKDETNN